MNWLLKNLWLKIVAFVMALLIWLHVATEKIYTYQLQLPITEITLKEGLTLSKEPPDSLLVAVTATGKQLLRHKWRDRGVRINTGQHSAGRFGLPVTAANTSLVQQSNEISLNEVILPTNIRLEVDFEDSVEVPVAPNISAVADDGFAVGTELAATPASAILVGPRSNLGQVKEVRTRHVRLESLRNTVTVRLPLEPPDGYGFKVKPDSVAVTIAVFPARTRIFRGVPVMVLYAPTGIAVRTDPSDVEVEITGPPEKIDQLANSAVTASVDYRMTSAGGQAAIRIDFPTGFRLKTTSADSARIHLDANDRSGD